MDGYPIYSSWLIKSCAIKRFTRPKWKQRYFVLLSKDNCGQISHVINYYVDESAKKPKGVICLDKCQQVIADINTAVTHGRNVSTSPSLDVSTSGESPLDNMCMFGIRTCKHTIYLSARSREVMDQWLTNICRVCNFSDCSTFARTIQDETCADGTNNCTSPSPNDSASVCGAAQSRHRDSTQITQRPLAPLPPSWSERCLIEGAEQGAAGRRCATHQHPCTQTEWQRGASPVYLNLSECTSRPVCDTAHCSGCCEQSSEGVCKCVVVGEQVASPPRPPKPKSSNFFELPPRPPKPIGSVSPCYLNADELLGDRNIAHFTSSSSLSSSSSPRTPATALAQPSVRSCTASGHTLTAGITRQPEQVFNYDFGAEHCGHTGAGDGSCASGKQISAAAALSRNSCESYSTNDHTQLAHRNELGAANCGSSSNIAAAHHTVACARRQTRPAPVVFRDNKPPFHPFSSTDIPSSDSVPAFNLKPVHNHGSALLLRRHRAAPTVDLRDTCRNSLPESSRLPLPSQMKNCSLKGRESNSIQYLDLDTPSVAPSLSPLARDYHKSRHSPSLSDCARVQPLNDANVVYNQVDFGKTQAFNQSCRTVELEQSLRSQALSRH